jgi:hypothetical protein
VTGRSLGCRWAGSALGLLLLVAPSVVGAQVCNQTGTAGSCTVNVTTSITLPTLPYHLTVGSSTTAFGTVTSTNFDAGFAELPGPSVTVQANKPWSIGISSAATFWTATNTDPTNPARTTKPRADLHWSNTSGVVGTAVTGTVTTIGSGTGTVGTVIPLFFRTIWDYTVDTPGNYTISVTFTLTAP